jgi:UDP-glucose 4-epimerase
VRVLVVGGAGFLGSHLVERLLAEGHEIEVVDDLSTGAIANLGAARSDARMSGRLRIHTLDAAVPELADLLSRREPDVVVHLAPVAGRAVLAASVGVASVTKIVAVDAALAEPLAAARVEHQVDFTVVDVAAEVHGPRVRSGTVCDLLAGRGVAGPPERTVELLAVEEAVDAIVRSLDRAGGLVVPLAGHRVALASVAMALGVLPSWHDLAADAPATDPMRARTYLGWRSFTPPADALAATASWWSEAS